MTKLNLANLGSLRAGVATPTYRREDLKPGILHIGLGNFHRAHVGVYMDRLFNLGLDKDWAIIGAGVMPSDARMREALLPQDYLSTVVEQEKDTSSARVTGPMVDFVPPGDVPALIARLADPAIRIVSLTVTEGGYMIDPATGKFDPGHPAIKKDAANPTMVLSPATPSPASPACSTPNSPIGWWPTSRSPTPWWTALRLRRPTVNARSRWTCSALKTIGQCSARNISSG
jgi:Mannitol dehydrogenase Rossmann domain